MAEGPYYPKGVYRGVITDQALGQSSNSNPQIVLRFNVLTKLELDGSETPVTLSYERTSFMTITEKTIDRIVSQLGQLGYDRESFRHIDPQDPNHFNFIGKETEFVCNHEEYQGKTREKWNVRTPRENTPLEIKPIESKKLRELDNLFGKHLKTLKPNGSTQTQPQPAAQLATGVTDDDVPF